MTSDEILEELSNLEHEQWMSWSKTALIKMKALESDEPDAFENALYWLQDHWQKNWKPYTELDEETKEHDRKWARKITEIIKREVSLARKDERENHIQIQFCREPCTNCKCFEKGKQEGIKQGRKEAMKEYAKRSPETISQELLEKSEKEISRLITALETIIKRCDETHDCDCDEIAKQALEG